VEDSESEDGQSKRVLAPPRAKSARKIPRPPGEVGRRTARGFDLRKTLGLEKQDYLEIRVS
jgi:hypothetical protein